MTPAEQLARQGNSESGSFASIYALLTSALPIDGSTVSVVGFYSGTSKGGGVFSWDATRSKADANGGTVIDPSSLGGWDGTAATLGATYYGGSGQGSGVGSGCWVRLHDDFPSAYDFGANGKGVVYDTAAIQAVLNSSINADVSDGEFLISAPLTRGISKKVIGGRTGTFKVDPSFQSGVVFLAESVDKPTRDLADFELNGVNFDATGVPYQHWLMDSLGNVIADPEADYVPGIGALASGISGVSLTPVITGDAVTSVTVNSGGSGFNGHPTFPYLPTTVPIKFVGDGFGATAVGNIVAGSIVSVTVTNGGYGYTVAPTATTLGGYADIALLVDPSVDRRNPNYTSVLTAVQLDGLKDSKVVNCGFKNIVGRGIFERGGLNVDIEHNTFDTVGKSDGPYHAIYTQSFGTPGGGQPFYSPSTDIHIRHNRASNLERSFCLFSPTGGGVLEGNVVDGFKESCVFITEVINSDGGKSTVARNTFKSGRVSDIVSLGVEAGGASGVMYDDNYIFDAEYSAMTMTGMSESEIINNRVKNNGSEFTYPYGPFSERFAFGVGTAPIAGTQRGLNLHGSFGTIGSVGGIGGSGVIIENNRITDDRATHPHSIFAQTKSGSNNIARGPLVFKNIIETTNTVPILNVDTANVWEYPYLPKFKDNLGHTSESPVVHRKQFAIGETGVYQVDVGFMPSRVEVFSAPNNLALGRGSIGTVVWTNTGHDQFTYEQSTNVGTALNLVRVIDDQIARHSDSVSTIRLRIDFNVWKETGFIVNVITALDITNVRFVCYP